MCRSGRRVGVMVVVAIGCALPARAQIYSWRDANGTLVLSDKRPPAGLPSVQSYAVPRSEAVRATRPGTPDGSLPFEDLIQEHGRRQNVRADLIRAVMQVESGFNPRARSPKGALGLMQLMPGTARLYRVSDAFDPSENVRAGVAYLRALLDRYDNDETLALAAYNAGPLAVDRHGQSVPPYRETRDYVKRINKAAGRPAAPQRDGRIYKVTEVVDGEVVVRYTDRRPASGTFEVVAR